MAGFGAKLLNEKVSYVNEYGETETWHFVEDRSVVHRMRGAHYVTRYWINNRQVKKEVFNQEIIFARKKAAA